MKWKVRSLVIFLAGLVLFSSCNNMKGDAKFIPRTALSVMHINVSEMHNKLDWKEVRGSAWFTKSLSSARLPGWLHSLAENPEKSGINFKKGLTFFVNGDSTQRTYVALTGSLDNEDDFKKFCAAVGGSSAQEEKNGVQIVSYRGELAAWKGKQFFYLTTNSLEGMNVQNEGEGGNPINLSAEVVRLFTLDKKSSLADMESFTALSKEKGDLQIWVNGQEVNKYGPAVDAMTMFNSDVFFENNFSTFNVNFNEGAIDIDQRQYASKKFIKYLNDNIGKSIDENMLERLPGEDVLGVFSLSLKPAAIEELVKLIGLDGLANMFLQQAGFTLQDLTKANNGNIMMAVTKNKTNADSVQEVKAAWLLAIGVKDKAAAQKIVGAVGKMLPEKSVALPDGNEDGMIIENNDNFILLSSSSAYAKEYLNGNAKVKRDFIGNIKGNAIAGHVNLQSIFALMQTSDLNTDTTSWRREMVQTNRSMWNTVDITGGKVKNDALHMNTVVRLQDQKTNSLVQLNKYVNRMYELTEEMQASTPDMRVDSTNFMVDSMSVTNPSIPQ